MPKRTKAEIIARMNEVGVMNRSCGKSICSRAQGDVALIDTENRMIPFVLVSENNAGERYDWWTNEIFIEELDPNGARLDNLQTFFKDHEKRVDTAIGRIENKRVDAKVIKADVFFGKDKDSDLVFQKYQDRILTDVSVGYVIHDITITENKGEPTHVLVTDYDIVELSAVWKGFDSGANIGRQQQSIPSIVSYDKRNIDTMQRQLKLKGKTA